MALREADSELDAIYNFYLDFNERLDRYGRPRKKEYEDYYDGLPHGNFRWEMFSHFLIDFYNKNGFPEVVNAEDYNDMLSNILVFRGERTFKYAGELIDSPTYHYGTGSYGVGIYTTDDLRRAQLFSSGLNGDLSYVIEMALSNDAKILKYEDNILLKNYLKEKTNKSIFKKKSSKIDEEFQTLKLMPEALEKLNLLIDFLREKKDKKFTEKFIDDKSNNLAIYLGYDAIERRESSFCMDYIVFNRGMLMISESEKDRLLEVCQNEDDDELCR